MRIVTFVSSKGVFIGEGVRLINKNNNRLLKRRKREDVKDKNE